MLDFPSEALFFPGSWNCMIFSPWFFFFFFFFEPTTWCIQFQTVLELSKSQAEATRYSSLALEKYAAIMNIMTVFVYRAGRQDIKVSLLMMNIKEMSVFRDGGNHVYWRLETIFFFNVSNSRNDPAHCVEDGIVKGLNRRWLGKGLIQSWMKSAGSPSS